MNVDPRHVVLMGLGDVNPSGLSPHKVTVLPPGLQSVATSFDVFDADLVVFGPSPSLFAPPADLRGAADLVSHITWAELVPPTLDIFSPWDESLDGAHSAGASRPRNRAKSKPQQPRRSAVVPAEPQLDVSDRSELLRTLVACGTSILRRSYDKGCAGGQDFIVFVPPQSESEFNLDGPYEPHCTAALIENWLGLKHHDRRLSSDADLSVFKWTPKAVDLGWPNCISLDDLIASRGKGALSFVDATPVPSLFKRGADICEDERGRAGDSGPGTWYPLILSRDGRHVIGGMFEFNDARIHVLPAPRDPMSAVSSYVKARYGLEPEGVSPRGSPRISISIEPCQPVTRRLGGDGVLGNRRGTGWYLVLNDRKVGIGETKFLQLLAFIAADRAGQAKGIDPTAPMIGGAAVKNVFRPSDGYRGKFARGAGGGRPAGKEPNPALAASEINQLFTSVCGELGIVEGESKIRIVTPVPGEEGHYQVNPEYREAISVKLSGGQVPHPDVRHVIGLIERAQWEAKESTPTVASRLWYASCPEQVEPIFRV
jgi:hypothetical protein